MNKKIISTGIYALDKMTAFHPSDLILIGGHPGVGKTTFMVSLARNIAYKKIK